MRPGVKDKKTLSCFCWQGLKSSIREEIIVQDWTFFFSSSFEVKQGINVPTKTRVPEEAKVSRRKEVRNHRMKRVTALPDSRGRCLSPSMLQVGGKNWI